MESPPSMVEIPVIDPENPLLLFCLNQRFIFVLSCLNIFTSHPPYYFIQSNY